MSSITDSRQWDTYACVPPSNGSSPEASSWSPDLRLREQESGFLELRVGALIPALDAESTVGDVVRGALEHVPHVVVVDDCSADRTAEVAASAGAEVVRHTQNRGKGAALKTGLVRLSASGFSHAFSLDADGQHYPTEMPRLLAEATAFPESIVLGSRRGDDQDVAPIKRFGNEFANWWVSLAAGRQFADTQSGFRVYPIEQTLALGVRAERYEFESEILILAALRGIEVRTLEIAVYYPPPGKRLSHYQPWLDTCRIIFTVVPFLVGVRR